MNGSEIETRSSQHDPFLEDQSLELSESEKMDLMAGDDSPYARAIRKLMRKEIIQAREDAVNCDPVDEKKQRALLTVAHAMKKFYDHVVGAVVLEKQSHFTNVKQKLAEAELQDSEKLQEVILYNQTH